MALSLAWLAVVVLGALAIVAGSIVLGVLGAVALAVAPPWSVTKWRDHAEARRLERRAAATRETADR
jgi:hypothetical protein